MKAKLLFAAPPLPLVKTTAALEFDLVNDPQEPLTMAQLLELAKQTHPDALLVGMAHKFGVAEVAQLPASVRIVATTSVGHDHLDVLALSARKIWATNTPDVLTDATADLTMLLLLSACRRLNESLELVERGWGRKLLQGELLGLDLKGKTLGILGMGRIGRAVSRRAQSFGMEVLYCNRRRLAPELEQGARFVADFGDLLPRSQVLSLHAPGTSETENIMGAKQFALLPSGAVLINVARGTMVDEEALMTSLVSGHLFAAALDVCRNEPHPDPRFLKIPNLILTPHVGSATRETRNAMGLRALSNVSAVVKGEKPADAL